MPLHRVPPRRANARPIDFFHGTLEEANELPAEGINELFHHGQHYPGVEQFKASMLEHIAATEPGTAQIVVADSPVGQLAFRVRRFGDGRVYIRQFQATHGITDHGGGRTFSALKKILETGFRGSTLPNVFVPNQLRGVSPATLGGGHASMREGTETRGDSYAIELLAPFSGYGMRAAMPSAFVNRATQDQIKRINIRLAYGMPLEEQERRKAFYRRELAKYGIPLVFVPHPRQR